MSYTQRYPSNPATDRLARAHRPLLPKDLLSSAPIDQVTVYWFDHDEGGGNRFRHFVTDFGDDTMRADRTGLTVLGKTLKSSTAETFVQALGERARPIPVD